MNVCALRHFMIEGADTLARTYHKHRNNHTDLHISYMYYDRHDTGRPGSSKIPDRTNRAIMTCHTTKYVILDSWVQK